MTKILEIAASEVGTREVGGNNLGPQIRVYQQATWLNPGAWPWCAAFTAWCLREWLATPEGIAYIDGHNPEKWRCRDAAAFGWVAWAINHGLLVMPPTARARAGDIVVFDFNGSSAGGGHIGIVAADMVDDFVESIDGNTNGKGERDSVTGDGVWRKRRHSSLVYHFIRLGDRAPT